MNDMDEIEVYKDFWKSQYITIKSFLDIKIKEGKKIAIWGAGLRGKAFLEIFDINNTYISYVYDINEKKWGSHMPTGQIIVGVDEEHETDVLLIMNINHDVETREKFIGKNVEIINVDNIVWGGLQIEDVLEPIKESESQLKNKIAAVTVLYNPTMDVYDNIKSYADSINNIYVYDNSQIVNKILVEQLKELPNVIYITERKNNGIAKAINDSVKLMRKEGIDWFFTFDQDSVVDKDMIKQMVSFSNSIECEKNKIGIIAPNIMCKQKVEYNEKILFVDKVIQSGMFNKIEAFDKIGGYDEKLFLEQVDFEYCIRLRLNGYKIVKVCDAYLKHNVSDDKIETRYVDGKKMFIDKYSPIRYYYQFRNTYYCKQKYENKDKIYALECENIIRKLKKNIELDCDSELKKDALQKGYCDFVNGKMGIREESDLKEG